MVHSSLSKRLPFASKLRSYSMKPSLGSVSYRCVKQNSKASVTLRPKRRITYMMNDVALRDLPIAQWINMRACGAYEPSALTR